MGESTEWRHQMERRVARLESLVTDAGAKMGPPKVESPAEFLRAKQPRSAQAKATVIGYYIEKVLGKSPFTLADIRRGFVGAKERLPSNSRDAVHRAIQSGLMMETGDTKVEGFRTLVLTNSGEKFVESLPN